jgi:hypothetical protein
MRWNAFRLQDGQVWLNCGTVGALLPDWRGNHNAWAQEHGLNPRITRRLAKLAASLDAQ